MDPRLIPLEMLEFDRAVVAAFNLWLKATAAPLLRQHGVESDEELTDHYAAERADGGLWLTGGSDVLWTIYGVAPGRWSVALDGEG
ncbi:MAG: hypothetical protein EPO40_16645 [Myxococcaceae bacterium]|nr:MAG: hypothetical protein EPO40_16645 [Myxococcaceae bacterium]